eukprot:265192_1
MSQQQQGQPRVVYAQQPQGQQIVYAQPPQGQQVVYVNQYGQPVQPPTQQGQQPQVVYVQPPQQAPETKQNDETDNKNKKQKGFMSKVFGNTPKHVNKEMEAVLGKKTNDALKKGAKDTHQNFNKEMANVGNQFNKEINGAFGSLFGVKKKKKQPQQQQQQ